MKATCENQYKVSESRGSDGEVQGTEINVNSGIDFAGSSKTENNGGLVLRHYLFGRAK